MTVFSDKSESEALVEAKQLKARLVWSQELVVMGQSFRGQRLLLGCRTGVAG